MTDQEFDAFLATAVSELQAKQRYLETEFALGSYERFFVDHERAALQFFRGDQVALSFSITEVGSHVPEKDSWRWAWSNSSLPEEVRIKASAVQRLYDITLFDLFRQPSASVDEAMAWEFVALSCKVLNALGAYSVPHSKLRAYVLIDAVEKKG